MVTDTDTIRVLLLGDVVGRPGREALKTRLRAIRRDFSLDLVIANGENAAGGIGLTAPVFRELREAGVDVVTSGNHIWRHADIFPVLEREDRLIRPANMPCGAPGKGHTVLELPRAQGGCVTVAVINLLGRAFMDPFDCPFRTVDAVLAALPESVRLVFVDFHAEATSEKRAMFFHLDGRVTTLAGTHTHVQTADATLSAKGTAYITDLGMCGNEQSSVLGMTPKNILERFIGGLPVRFTPISGLGTLNGLLVEADARTGQALAVSLFRDNAPEFSSIYPQKLSSGVTTARIPGGNPENRDD